LSAIRIVNQIGSIPSVATIGAKIGTTIKDISIKSRKNPSIKITSIERAIKAYEKGGKNYKFRNDVECYIHLGVLYENGNGVKKDFKKAFYLYQKGANLGEKTAKFALAEMYRWGKGTKQDLQKATPYLLIY